MTENQINAKVSETLSRHLGPEFWFAKTSDRSTGGRPDFDLIGFDRYSGWEMKYADPNFKLPALQLLTCQRLERVSYCRFVIFHKLTNNIHIVNPYNMSRNKSYTIEKVITGFDYETLVRFMTEVHTR